jgi:hypothetical protein
MAISIKKPTESGVYIPPDTVVEANTTFYKGAQTIWGGSKWLFRDECVQSSPGNFSPITIDDATWSAFLREFHSRGQ